MLGPGPLIAIDVILLYTILGPLVLFAIYVLFDTLNRPERSLIKHSNRKTEIKNIAVWTNEEIDAYLDRM
jgi:hypothetical protein